MQFVKVTGRIKDGNIKSVEGHSRVIFKAVVTVKESKS